MRLVIISGMSGGGRSQALKRMEDMGYFCVDNLPPELIPSFALLCAGSPSDVEKAALVVDTRAREFYLRIFDVLEELKLITNVKFEVLFLDARDDVLIRRYSETRRRHPLSRAGYVQEGIARERELLEPLQIIADHVVDTSDITVKQLNDQLEKMFGVHDESDDFLVMVTTFGFKRRIPQDADMMLDVRFIPNPFYIDELKKLSGKDPRIREYIFSFSQARAFMDKLTEMVMFLIPYYRQEDKNQLVIAIGCTGGMHRSVAIGEALFERLKELDVQALVYHRDIDMDLQK